jgi:translation initiation factor 1
VASKRDQVDNALEGGILSHNPFASLLGGSGELGEVSTPGKRPSPAERAAPAAEPSSAKVVVRFEAKGHGGKTVTRISGLDLDPAALQVMAKALKKAMGTGARVVDEDVLVQGKAVERVARWLKKNGHPHVISGN